MIYRKVIQVMIAGVKTSVYKTTQLSAISTYKNFFIGLNGGANEQCAFFDRALYCGNYLNNSTQYSIKRIVKLTKRYFISSRLFFFKKFRFKGKGYKVRKVKFKKSFKFLFNHSHQIYGWAGGLMWKKLTKYKTFLISNRRASLIKVATEISNVRKLNSFTKRGLRKTKTLVFKRPGKKSNY